MSDEATSESDIRINGQRLSVGQVMAVRVAVTTFHAHMGLSDPLGDDEHGRAMAAAYRSRLGEVVDMMLALISSRKN